MSDFLLGVLRVVAELVIDLLFDLSLLTKWWFWTAFGTGALLVLLLPAARTGAPVLWGMAGVSYLLALGTLLRSRSITPKK